jgi:hypothetical protein
MLLLLAVKTLQFLIAAVPAATANISADYANATTVCCVSRHQPPAQSDHPCLTLLICMLLLLAVKIPRLIAAVPAGNSQQLS